MASCVVCREDIKRGTQCPRCGSDNRGMTDLTLGYFLSIDVKVIVTIHKNRFRSHVLYSIYRGYKGHCRDYNFIPSSYSGKDKADM